MIYRYRRGGVAAIRLVPGVQGFKNGTVMNLLATISSAAEGRSARLAGIGLMLAGVFFLVGRCAREIHGRDLFGGPAFAAPLGGGAGPDVPVDLAQPRRVSADRSACVTGLAGHALDTGDRAVLRGFDLPAARRYHHVLSGGADLRHRVVGDLARRARRYQVGPRSGSASAAS